jgi:hypothetical protein
MNNCWAVTRRVVVAEAAGWSFKFGGGRAGLRSEKRVSPGRRVFCRAGPLQTWEGNELRKDSSPLCQELETCTSGTWKLTLHKVGRYKATY